MIIKYNWSRKIGVRCVKVDVKITYYKKPAARNI